MPTRRPRTKAQDHYSREEEEETGGGQEENGAAPGHDAPFVPMGKRDERRMLSALVESRVGTPLGREPRSSDEKRELYLQLVRLKAARKTHEECAEAMGVSRSTIANYLADPLYKEMQAELISEAKDRGHVLIGELVDFALERMVALTGAQSEFVRFKALEYILNAAGYNLPREESRRDNQEGLSRFMELLSARSGGGGKPTPATVVNVEVHTGTTSGEGKKERDAGEGEVGAGVSYVESHLFPVETNAEEGSSLSSVAPAAAYPQVLPGGKLPPLQGLSPSLTTPPPHHPLAPLPLHEEE